MVYIMPIEPLRAPNVVGILKRNTWKIAWPMNKEVFKFKCTLTYNATFFINFKEHFSAIKILKVLELDSTYLRSGRIVVITETASLRQDQDY